MYGMCAVVLPVHCEDGKRGALKVSWLDDETRLESVALRTWGGHGAVSVLRTDEMVGTMLLERLDERRVLLDVPIQEALDTAAYLLRELRSLRSGGGSANRAPRNSSPLPSMCAQSWPSCLRSHRCCTVIFITPTSLVVAKTRGPPLIRNR